MKHPLLKNVVILSILVGNCQWLFSQQTDSLLRYPADSLRQKKYHQDILKINLSAVFLENFSLQFEKPIRKKNSVALAINFRPLSSMPFESTVKKLINQPNVRVDLFKMGDIGITPEYRFYLGKKPAPLGFYLGPFISYHHYNADVPVNYMSDTKTGIFTGSMNTFTAGVQVGAQWKLSDQFYLDWWIVGPNYGITRGDFVCNTPLNDEEQISMDFELFRIQQGTTPQLVHSYKVSPTGASFNVKGPWGGLRAFGLNLGYRL